MQLHLAEQLQSPRNFENSTTIDPSTLQKIQNIITALGQIPLEQRKTVVGYVNQFLDKAYLDDKNDSNIICSIINAVAAIPEDRREAVCQLTLKRYAHTVMGETVGDLIREAMSLTPEVLRHATRLLGVNAYLFPNQIISPVIEAEDFATFNTEVQLPENPALYPALRTLRDYYPQYARATWPQTPAVTLADAETIIETIQHYTFDESERFGELLADQPTDQNLVDIVEQFTKRIRPIAQPRTKASDRSNPRPRRPAAEPRPPSHQNPSRRGKS